MIGGRGGKKIFLFVFFFRFLSQTFFPLALKDWIVVSLPFFRCRFINQPTGFCEKMGSN